MTLFPWSIGQPLLFCASFIDSVRPAMNRTLLLAASLALASAVPPARAADALDIPYQTFKLDNGLTVVVHEDHKAPIVAVDLWYHVGSKNEKTGKTGFAHLFEHLMFQTSEHHP